MQIDYCLILAAGFGTRMGTIGKKLPKVLWPVFEKTLLELQVAYAKSLGAKRIFINLHHMGEEIELFCRDRAGFEGVELLWEKPEILDIGGAVHNLAAQASVNYQGRLLVLNADQFFFLGKDEFIRVLAPYKKSACVLFSYWVNSSLGYNALEIDDERTIKGIVKNEFLSKNQTVETYTGISVIDLAQLDRTSGVSSFFDSVCPFKEKTIPAILLKNIDYWDFGTAHRYWETMFKILETYRVKSVHPFIRFLVSERAIKTWKIDLQKLSYNARAPRVINLDSTEAVIAEGPAIILSGVVGEEEKSASIWWKGIREEIR